MKQSNDKKKSSLDKDLSFNFINFKTYRFQIKANDSGKKTGSNLKFEPTAKGAAAARMGKATRELVFDLMRSPKYNIYLGLSFSACLNCLSSVDDESVV